MAIQSPVPYLIEHLWNVFANEFHCQKKGGFTRSMERILENVNLIKSDRGRRVADKILINYDKVYVQYMYILLLYLLIIHTISMLIIIVLILLSPIVCLQTEVK